MHSCLVEAAVVAAVVATVAAKRKGNMYIYRSHERPFHRLDFRVCVCILYTIHCTLYTVDRTYDRVAHTYAYIAYALEIYTARRENQLHGEYARPP